MMQIDFHRTDISAGTTQTAGEGQGGMRLRIFGRTQNGTDGTGQVFIQAAQRMQFNERRNSSLPEISLRPLSSSTICISAPGAGP